MQSVEKCKLAKQKDILTLIQTIWKANCVRSQMEQALSEQELECNAEDQKSYISVPKNMGK